MSTRDPLAAADQDSVLWTFEEIGRLVSQSGNPAETLSNLVHLIKQRFATDVCSVYLLEADRSSLVLAATIGLRPEGVGRIRMRLTEGLAGLVAEQLRPQVLADASTHPRFKYFREAGEDAYRSFLGVPILDRGLLLGVLVVQTAETRTFSQDDVRMLGMAGAQLAPIVNEARALGQSVAPAHERLYALAHNLWWSWDNDATTLFRELDPVRWREFDHNPIALLQQIPIEALEERAQQLQLHSRINYAYRRMQEYLKSDRTWGARNAGVLWARPVAYFSAEFGLHESLPIYSGGLGILAGDHVKSASDLGIPLVGVGLYYDQGYFKQRLDLEGRQHEDYLDVDSGAAADPACGPRRPAGHDFHRDPHRHYLRPRLAARRRAEHALPARLQRRRQPAGRSRADRAALRRRRPGPHPPGAASRGRRGAGLDGARHLARRGPPQRRAQRVRRARVDAPPHGDRGHRRVGGSPPRLGAGRLHHAHAGAGRARSLPSGSRRRASRAAARIAADRVSTT